MKRYGLSHAMIEFPDGEYVKYEDAESLHNEIQHLKARIAELEKQNDCPTVEEQKSILEFVEPHPTGGTCYVRISKEKAIAWQKRKWPQATDEDALEDFKVVHWAFEV